MIIEGSSFRDNSGFVFYENGEIFRAINYSYKENYEHLMGSGMYDYLVKENLLISHTEVEQKLTADIFKIIKPQKIDFISYPYEWCFSELKDAALTTLTIQKTALEYGMTLKDSSAYNIQFHEGKAILIDTLSFEIYKENEPWVAYNQFCKNFLAPLALASLCDVRLNLMLRDFIDGIPLDAAKNILRKRVFLKPGIFIHIFLHSYFQNKYSDKEKPVSVNTKWMNKNSQIRLIENLEKIIQSLIIKRKKTNWSDYYSNQFHSKSYLDNKKEIVRNYLENVKVKRVWDIGANDGEFSKIAAANSGTVIAFDSDYDCIEKCYDYIKKNKVQNLIPLVVDLVNPSPSIGWANSERKSLIERANADLVLALALIHHLCISNNVPLGFTAEFFSKICMWLIIEFVPKSDPMVKKLLLHRKDIFDDYCVESFEKEFLKYFSLFDQKNVSGSNRVIYLMKKNNIRV